jgi:hypothetical protein
MNEAELKATVELRGTFELRDKDGNVVKVIPFVGSLPLKDEDGTDDSE